jgi:hypothetical protein
VTVGLIPTAGFNKVSSGPSSSGVGLGDLTLQTQYRLTKFHEGSWIPTTSVADNMGQATVDVTQNVYNKTWWWEERVEAVSMAAASVWREFMPTPQVPAAI